MKVSKICTVLIAAIALMNPVAEAATKKKGKSIVAAASFKGQCPSTRALKRCEIWKSIASTHIPRSDRRRNSSSLIGLAGCGTSVPSCIPIVDGKGNVVHKLGRYFPTGGKYSFRHYGGHGCGDAKSASAVAALARRNTGSTAVYADLGSVCVQVPNPATCYNSSAC